ncbi:LysR family transcriptional regulator [Gordonia soli]|uniref:LysR family transcriptional regulator n=1 Tax=Gordonia soli TaxID=320799 RepID=UPI00034A4510|nr:LysR family transcriptional regulator [Gordonia soli]
MTTLDIVPLRSFVAVAAFSSMRGAADALHLSPPAITRHIRKLEHELGCRLVVPEGRGIALTSDGEELVGRARELLQQHDDTVHALTPHRTGELLVAATEHAAELLVPPVISILSQRLPDRRVQLRLTRSAHVRDLVDDARADIALMLTPPTPTSTMIADIPVRWYGTDTAPRDRLVLFSRPCAVRHHALASLSGRENAIAKECLHLSAVLTAARAGIGITALPEIGPAPDGLHVLHDMPSISTVPLSVATSDRVGAATHAAVVNELRAMVGPTRLRALA